MFSAGWLKMFNLISLMLKEEYRFHTSYTSKYAFMFFPVFAFMLAFLGGVSSSKILEEISLKQVLLSLHGSLLLYGMIAGSFAFLGRGMAESRFGNVNFMITMPDILPLSFRKAFFALYLREIIFYTELTIFPVTLGLLFSTFFSSIKISSVLFLFITMLLSFLFGISLSFFLSSIYRRSIKIFSAFIGGVIFLISISALFHIPVENIIPTVSFHFTKLLSYLLTTIALILIFSVLGILLAKKEIRTKIKHFENAYPKIENKLVLLWKTPKAFSQYFRKSQGLFHEISKYSILMAKELIDIKRSNTVVKMFFSFLLPLIFMTGLLWFVEENIPVGFNSISHAIFIGFFSLVIYSWLNNMCSDNFFDIIPVTVNDVIKTRILVHIAIVSIFLVLFVPIISVISNEIYRIPVALFVGFTVSLYMVFGIAYLTGLRPNTYLFNPEILVEFGIISVLPQVPLVIFSLMPNHLSLFFVLFICILLLASSYLFYKDIEEKWGKESFT